MKINSSTIKGVEFDEKGNIKLPPTLQKRKEENEILFKEGRAIRISQIENSCKAPRDCSIIIEISPMFKSPEKIESVYKQSTKIFKHFANLSFKKISRNQFEVKIISGEKRCSWCNSFINYLSKRLNLRIIKEIECLDEFSKPREYSF